MAEYQITYWREIPSMVIAREGEATSKVALPNRFQEAIDEAAMRAGASDADAYLADWRREDWRQRDGDPAAVAEAVAGELDEAFPPERLNGLLGQVG
jgi:Virulence factor